MIIYKATNKINGKVYIGQTIERLSKRKAHHHYLSKTNNGSYFHKAIKKYGLNCFVFETIDQCNNRKKLNEKEIYWINFYKSAENKFGYNLSTGGGGLSGYKLTEDHKKKISLSRIGEKNPNFRGKHTWNKGLKGQYKLSDEHKRKISISGMGRKFSEESKKKIGIGNSGERCGSSKLKECDVIFIKKHFRDNGKNRELKNKYNVSMATLCDIKKGRTWRHVKI